MKAVLLLKDRSLFLSRDGRPIVIEMDLYRIDDGRAGAFPEGYRFSWIAFDQEEPEKRILFDCHPPKGPHFHIDADANGIPFSWVSLDDAIRFFREKTRERFGDLEPVAVSSQEGG